MWSVAAVGHGVAGCLCLIPYLLRRADGLVLDRGGRVGRRGLDRLGCLLAGVLKAGRGLLGRAGDSWRGGFLDLDRCLLFGAAGRHERAHKPANADGDQADGQGITRSLAPQLSLSRRHLLSRGRTHAGGGLRRRPHNFVLDTHHGRTRAGSGALGHVRRVDRVGQGVDVLAEAGARFLDMLADLIRIAGHDLPSFPVIASGIFFTVCAVCATPDTAVISRRPTSPRTVAMISQAPPTISADQPWPMASPMPHQAATDTNTRTKWPATPAPASIPAPLPARVADWRSSALASSTSWRISVLRSAATSENASPTAGRESGAGAAVPCGLVTVGSRCRPGRGRARRGHRTPYRYPGPERRRWPARHRPVPTRHCWRPSLRGEPAGHQARRSPQGQKTT